MNKSRSLEVSVKVGNLEKGTASHEVRQAFIDAGLDTMTDVYVPGGKSFGFLRFAKLSDAQAAMQCAGMLINGSPITCELAEGDKRSSEEMAYGSSGKGGFGKGVSSFNQGRGVNFHTDGNAFSNEVSIRVGNLPHDISPDELCEAFAAQGVDSMTDCYIPQGRRFGFLRFQSAAEGKLALTRKVRLRGLQLELEPAMGSKRSSAEMAYADAAQPAPRQPKMARSAAPGRGVPAVAVPDNPDVSPNAPSVKVSGVPPGTSSEMIHAALISAGCASPITDVYVPKGDRGFAFVRFARQQEAEAATQLQAYLRGSPLGLEVAVQERRAAAKLSAAVRSSQYGTFGVDRW